MPLALAHHLLPTELLTVLSHLRPLPLRLRFLSVSASLPELGTLGTLRTHALLGLGSAGASAVGRVGKSGAVSQTRWGQGAWLGEVVLGA